MQAAAAAAASTDLWLASLRLLCRYLEYEKVHGTAATVEHVKRRAMEYVEAQAAA